MEINCNDLQLFLRDYTIDKIKIRVTNPTGMTQKILTLALWPFLEKSWSP